MISKLYLSLNLEKEDANKVAHNIKQTCDQYSMSVVDDPKDADCVVTIGGDGTYLYGSRLALKYSIPLAGVNLGRFGFLPSFSANNPHDLLNCLKLTQPHIRCVLDIDTGPQKFNAINEIVVERKSTERALRLSMISSPPIYGTLQQEISAQGKVQRQDFLNSQMDEVISEFSAYSDETGNPVKGTAFVCDGVVVATPLGSTAYSSSAGGPAISPYSNVMSVTLVALHHPRIPAVVLTNNENLYLRAEEECVIVCDGRQMGELVGGEAVRISVGQQLIRVFEKPASVVSKLAHAFGADRIH